MTTLAFEKTPSQGPHYLKALLARKPGLRAGQTLPALDATLSVAPQPARLAAYRALCGFGDRGVPITFPHLLASPLHLALLTARDFPLPAMGLLHVANQIVQHRALREDETLSLRVALAGPREARRGLELELRSEARTGGELVWESTTTLLHRAPRANGKPSAEGASSAAPGASIAPHVPTAPHVPPAPIRSELWQLPPDLGRRYARLSGDFNPIHLWPITARLFGFRRPIIHGMWTLARAAAALSDLAPEGASILDVRFKRPLLLPGSAQLSASGADGAQSFRVADRAGSEIFLEGSWSPRASAR